jgi:hypothetical protein
MGIDRRENLRIVGCKVTDSVCNALDRFALEHNMLKPNKQPNRSEVIHIAIAVFLDCSNQLSPLKKSTAGQSNDNFHFCEGGIDDIRG